MTTCLEENNQVLIRTSFANRGARAPPLRGASAVLRGPPPVVLVKPKTNKKALKES